MLQSANLVVKKQTKEPLEEKLSKFGGSIMRQGQSEPNLKYSMTACLMQVLGFATLQAND